MVPLTRLELVRYFYRGILSPSCLPIPPQRQDLRYQSDLSVKYSCLLSSQVTKCHLIDNGQFFLARLETSKLTSLEKTTSEHLHSHLSHILYGRSKNLMRLLKRCLRSTLRPQATALTADSLCKLSLLQQPKHHVKNKEKESGY